jgi:hypothetical protein
MCGKEFSMYFGNFVSLLPQLGLSYFLCRSSVISRHVPVKVVTRGKQDVSPGYDDNKDGPIGCFVAKDAL